MITRFDWLAKSKEIIAVITMLTRLTQWLIHQNPQCHMALAGYWQPNPAPNGSIRLRLLPRNGPAGRIFTASYPRLKCFKYIIYNHKNLQLPELLNHGLFTGFQQSELDGKRIAGATPAQVSVLVGVDNQAVPGFTGAHVLHGAHQGLV